MGIKTDRRSRTFNCIKEVKQFFIGTVIIGNIMTFVLTRSSSLLLKLHGVLPTVSVH